MASKTFKTRHVQKNDVQANWEKATNFIPLKGELIIYDPDDNYSYARVKIGDGSRYVNELPFLENVGPAGTPGEKGDPGRGISSITKTNTSGLVDTYNILYTDGTSTAFNVTNGSKGDPGENGVNGANGISVTHSWNDTKLTLTSASGTTTTDLRGLPGTPGDPGVSAGFGTPTATVDANVGTPSVTVTTSGPNTAKVFNFEFKNLKGQPGTNGVDGLQGDKGDPGEKGEKGDPGEKGDSGAAAGFGTPTATVDANVGIPSVTVTASGEDTAKVFNFNFKNLKGEPGNDGTNGADGIQGEKGEQGDPGIGIKQIKKTNTEGLVDTYTITFTDDSTTTFNIINGAQGEKGDPGEPGTPGDPGSPGADGLNGLSIYTISDNLDSGDGDCVGDLINNNRELQNGDLLISTNGLLFQITDCKDDPANPYIEYITSIQGPQGNTGEAGGQGPQGDPGPAGPYFTPSIDDEGNLSWTNTGGLENPEPVNVFSKLVWGTF